MTASSLMFAHLTDIHISENSQTWSTLGFVADRLLAETVARLNQQPDLDFVLITGDVLDSATPGELERFTGILRSLEKPWHFVPGNHDGFYDPAHPEAFAPHEAVPLIDPRLADPRPDAQQARWSREVAPGVRLIGLDSRIADNWNGRLEPEQLAWLAAELESHRRDIVLLAVHHPIHNLLARSMQPWWSNFICDNPLQIEALLEAYPQVKMVFAGHHHVNQIRRRGSRLHVCTAPLSGYPCVYRTIRLTRQEDGAWQVRIETHSPADEEIIKHAFDLLLDSSVARRYDPGSPAAWADFAAGEPRDQFFEGLLG